ncbi:hypothetical protein CONPUDRAFT_133632 [Coniophora puteana RWD-64-598 SS2]|uniref:Uncharacterized protein n=1 Tax=Coniophora puteana (strain RWD-64-598) TaxID=741705 RepID=A0A5M3N3J8_CONPW|nr:uncharacterized protein CONPUDRAFT_133632 [Coniophora puteana RWD-64-598 SS2]EIW85933.1 hypothetical protein CONPUDRAFT_133632 [Coniophora puteana RWD-64-598 SS2]
MSSAPTTNPLDSHYAARAIRTTQKPTAFFGETPYDLESELPIALASLSQQAQPAQKSTPKSLRRHGSIFAHHASPSSCASVSSSACSSTDSLLAMPPGLGSPSSASRKPKGTRPAFLKLNNASTTAHPASPSDTSARFNFTSFLPCSPLRSQTRPASTPSPIWPPTPHTALPSPPCPEVIRQKRLAKLSRTLGEDIPAELVFPPQPSRRASEERLAPAPAPAPAAASAVSAAKRKQRRRSKTLDFGSGGAVPRSPAPFDPYFQRAPEDIPPVPALPEGAKAKREQPHEWVGEWNRDNIRDVQKALRHLRL